MKNVRWYEGTLRILDRLPQSVNGNARFHCALDMKFYTIVFRTAVDCCLADYVKNYNGRAVECAIGHHYGHPTLDKINLIK